VPDVRWLAAGLAIFESDARIGAAGLAPCVLGGNWIVRASALFASPRAGTRERATWLPSANLFVRRAAFERARERARARTRASRQE